MKLSSLCLITIVMFFIASVGFANPVIQASTLSNYVNYKSGEVFANKRITCRIEALLGKMRYKDFLETVPSVYGEMPKVKGAPYLFMGNVKGLGGIMGGILAVNEQGDLWLAYAKDGKIHYYSTVAKDENKIPSYFSKWLKLFAPAKVVYSKIDYLSVDKKIADCAS